MGQLEQLKRSAEQAAAVARANDALQERLDQVPPIVLLLLSHTRAQR